MSKLALQLKELVIKHVPDKKYFMIDLSKQGIPENAYLNYQILDAQKHHYNFYHVEVPPASRGTGLANYFVTNVFDEAKKNQWKLQVTCTYMQDWLTKENRSQIYKEILL